MKRIYYFSAGVALGAMATRRTRRAKEVARAALAAKLTPSVIAADVADAIAELGNAMGAFAADLRQGAANRRATYRPMVDGATGSIAMLAPDQLGPAQLATNAVITNAVITTPVITTPVNTDAVVTDAVITGADGALPAGRRATTERGRRSA